MTSSSKNLNLAKTYVGNDHVVFGNSNSSPISHISKKSLSQYIKLSDVLVVPSITKNLLSISRLMYDSPVDVLFSNPFFAIKK